MASPDDELAALLSPEAALIERFVLLLEAEQSALAEGLMEEVARIGAEKEPLTAELQRIGERRSELLGACGFSRDREGMAAWAAKNPDAAFIWNTTLTLAARARDVNRLNGELIRMRLQYNARILEILQRNTLALDLYGPDGRTSASTQKRIDDAV